MTTFTTEDREEAEKRNPPVVIVDSGASYEPIPFAGLVDIENAELREELKRLQIENDLLRYSGKYSDNH